MKNYVKMMLFVLLLVVTAEAKQKLQTVVLQLPWYHQYEFAGFYAAKEQGFYKELGLNVVFQELEQGKGVVDTVVNRHADFGVTGSFLIAEYLNKKPVVLLANFLKQSPVVIVTQKDIKSVEELQDRTIMDDGDPTSRMIVDMIFEKFNLATNRVTWIAPSFDLQDFIGKKVDAMIVFNTNEVHQLEKLNVDFNTFDPGVYGFQFYNMNLFTSKSFLHKNPKLVEAFQKGSIQGWQYTLAHKKEMVALVEKKYNTTHKTKEALEYEANAIEALMLAKLYPVGSIDRDKLKLLGENFIQHKFVKSQDLKSFTNFIYDPKEEIDITGKISLNKDEREYLEKKKSLKMCIDPNWMPYAGVFLQQYTGIDSDFVKLFEKKLGKPIEMLSTNNWSESLQNVKDGNCDFVSLTMRTSERSKYLNFTTPYMELPLVVVATKEKSSVMDLSVLENKTIAIVKGYGWIDIIKKNYPNLNVLEVKNIKEGLERVSTRKVYGFLDNPLTIEYYMQNSDYEKLKTIVVLKEKIDLAIGVGVNAGTPLVSIMQKVVTSVRDLEKHAIFEKWNYKLYEQNIDYVLIVKIAVFFGVIIAVLVYRNYEHKKVKEYYAKKFQQELESSRKKDETIFEQRKMASMGEMIDTIAHQWRQPLSEINSSVVVIDSEVYRERIDKQLVEKHLESIENTTKFLSETIDDFRYYFDPNKKKESFYLYTILEKTFVLFQGVLKKYKISIENDADKTIACYGYPKELQQILMILIQNSIDALIENKVAKGNISIKIEELQRYNKILVCDNAGGIPIELLEKIFEPNFTTKNASKGRGIGLYMAKSIVENMQGHLDVFNNENGACFEILLHRETEIDDEL